jgi:4,4'-diaponeurosporenoate glycosyltransferase
VTTSTIAFVVVGLLAGTVLAWRLPRLPGPTVSTATVSVVVPARDEALNLPGLLASLAAQTHPLLEVVVVNDGSTDATAAVAADRGATVLTATALPAGWAGKAWACRTGAAAARGDHLLLLDADVRLAPDAVARLMAVADDGLVSVQPFHDVVRPYEQLSAFPNAVALLASGIAAVRPSRRPGLAFGPCLCTTPATLAAAGGFEGVAGEAIEDIALARAYERAGRSVTCVAGGASVRFRMYPDGVRSLIEGWGKNLSGGARRARPLPLLGAVLWVCAAVATSLEVLQADTPWTVVAYAAFAVQLWWVLRRIGSFRWWVAVAFPVPLLAFLGLFAWSLIQRVVRRRVTWRGRRIAV